MEANKNAEQPTRENGDSNVDTLNAQFVGLFTPEPGTDQGNASGQSFESISNPPLPPPITDNISTDKDKWYYNMNHKHRGIALIFNHQHFEIGGFDSRLGTEKDCFDLGTSLDRLDFDVFLYIDLTCEEIDEKIDHWVRKDYTDYDCIFVAVLTHGRHGIIFARDAPYVPDYKLWGKFTGEKCPTLVGKPKLFFIQACRGNRLDDGSMLATQVDGSPSSFKIPNHADFLIAYSTIPGFFSWRNTEHGSWFIQALADGFNKFGFDLDLLTILTFVNRKVAIDFESTCTKDNMMLCKKQIPCFTSMLTRLVKFVKKNN